MKARHLAAFVAFPFILLAVGTTGYVVIERWSAFDALYMTVITLTTLGFGEVHPLSSSGRAFTMALALGGIFSFFFAATSVITFAVSGDFHKLLRGLVLDRKLAHLHDHVIVCGGGRMGRLVARQLARQSVDVVLIESSERVLAESVDEFPLAVHGDASSDALLEKVGVKRARALVAALGSDADNVFVTMSARALNPTLFIVARAVEETTDAKLVRAGANRVVAPFAVGGYVAATAILHPTVIDSVDLASRTGHLEVQIEEITLAPGCALCERALGEVRIAQEVGVLVVALRKSAGETIFNPSESTRPEPNDTLVVMGRREQLDRLERLTAGA